MNTIERWGVFEVTLRGPETGNPFLDVSLEAVFSLYHRQVRVTGFYDGEGLYRIRFMPDTPGEWQYQTISNAAALHGKTGAFVCGVPSAANHGPVGVVNTYHFAYADGSPYYPFGTTCYAWIHQGETLEQQTLQTLRQSPFNKLRMCVFPKDYLYNANEPDLYAFEPAAGGGWDYTRFNPAFFRHLEKRVNDLLALGIEADIILLHPYDRWGFASMGAQNDDRYLRYVVARLAAYRNVWWSMANEYDLMKGRTLADWDRYFKIVQESDPSHHLRSVHNCYTLYDHTLPWVTHCSIQHNELSRVPMWREQYRRPVVVDECGYEGNIERRWGNLPAREMLHRIWLGTLGGGYVGHGETYLEPSDRLWWAKGGTLRGQSAMRIGFLRNIIESAPQGALNPLAVDQKYPAVGLPGQYYLYYYSLHQPGLANFTLPAGNYQIEVIDPWEMSIQALPGTYTGECTIPMPSLPYQAVRIQRI